MKTLSHAPQIFLLIVFLFLASPLYGETEVYFSQETDILSLLHQQINRTNTTLYAAISSIDLGEIVQAMAEARKRGVKVRLILDEGYARGSQPLVNFMLLEGIEVRLLQGEAGGRMNNNFAIFDGTKLLTGSYSWTERSNSFNLEDVLLIDEPSIVQAYSEEFEGLVGLSKLIAKGRSLKPLPTKVPPRREVESGPFLDISFKDMESVLGKESKLSRDEKKRAWEENYLGRYIEWQGTVVYKGIGRMDWNRIGISHTQGDKADVEVSFNWGNMNSVLNLKEGDLIIYSARFWKRKGLGSPYRLDDGEIIRSERKR